MNFSRSLFSTILVAVFGAIVLGGVSSTQFGSAGASASAASQGISATTFSIIFLLAACSFGVSFIATVLMNEKPLQT